jgi:hypothetical protein
MPPTREEQRIVDNVRPRGELDPALCSMRSKRPLFDGSRNCAVCGHPWFGSTAHCHLLEMCDRCHDETNPCDTARRVTGR